MRVANVQDGHFILDEIKTIAVTETEIKRYLLKHGDVLLTEGGDPDKLGRGSVWEEQIENCIHQNHIFRVRVLNVKKLNPYYLSSLISSIYGKAYFLKAAKQTTGIASINSTQLKKFPLVLPPINLQNKFVAIVEKVGGLKTSYQKSLSELENLYGSLSQRAFKGELDLSKVPLDVVVTPEPIIVKGNICAPSVKAEGIGHVSRGYTEENLIKTLKQFRGKIFSFDELWAALTFLDLAGLPEQSEIQDKIVEMLEADNANLTQVFDFLFSEDSEDNKNKKIALRFTDAN